jgi:hypothetical protein
MIAEIKWKLGVYIEQVKAVIAAEIIAAKPNGEYWNEEEGEVPRKCPLRAGPALPAGRTVEITVRMVPFPPPRPDDEEHVDGLEFPAKRSESHSLPGDSIAPWNRMPRNSGRC